MGALRVSSYAILSDELPRGGYALMSGLTGGVDLVSEEVASLLKASGGLRRSQGAPLSPTDGPVAAESGFLGDSLPGTVQRDLLDRGYLTHRTHDEEEEVFRQVADALHANDSGNPNFLIIPYLDCNYRCTYCFERPVQVAMNAKSDRAKAKMLPMAVEAHHERNNVSMTPALVRRAFEAIDSIGSRSALQRRQIVLYGGEPLERSHFGTVRSIVEEAKSRSFSLAAITNGHDLDAYLDLLGEDGIAQLQISIDGPKRIHDKRRIHVGGESSFDRIVRNLRLVLARGGTLVQLRVHVDPSNVDHFAELMDELREQGWLNHPDIVVYANTVYWRDKDDGRVFVKKEHSEISRDIDSLIEGYRNVYASAPEINAASQILPMLRDGRPYRLRSTYCSANTGQFIFAPDGHVYACWESVGRDASRIGSFDDGLELDAEATELWFGRHSGRIDACSRCPFGLVCGGGCAQYAEYNSSTQLAPYCDDFDDLFRRGLARSLQTFIDRQVAIAEGEEVPFDRVDALLYG